MRDVSFIMLPCPSSPVSARFAVPLKAEFLPSINGSTQIINCKEDAGTKREVAHVTLEGEGTNVEK